MCMCVRVIFNLCSFDRVRWKWLQGCDVNENISVFFEVANWKVHQQPPDRIQRVHCGNRNNKHVVDHCKKLLAGSPVDLKGRQLQSAVYKDFRSGRLPSSVKQGICNFDQIVCLGVGLCSMCEPSLTSSLQYFRYALVSLGFLCQIFDLCLSLCCDIHGLILCDVR